MKSIRISAALACVLLGAPMGADAAYPAYPAYQARTQQYTGYNAMPAGAYTMPQTGAVMQNRAAIPNQIMYPTQTATTNVAAAPATRITGALPRVGSTATTAGRSYYQPADYDRLADSGLYIGLSVAYGASVSGGMTADYQGEANAFFVPGAFQEAEWSHDTVIPLQVSVGAALNSDWRVDFSYTRYSNIGYLETVTTSDGAGGFIDASATGGAVTANATMLNIYYNIDSYTGYLAGGALRPYVGAGVGISLNTIGDYVIYDGTFYSEKEPDYAGAGELTGISDVYAYHNGGTTENLAFMLEAGVSTELGGGLALDLYARYANVGKVKSSGSIIVSQTEWIGDGAGGESPAPYDSVFHYTNWYESGRLSTIDIGARLRLQF
ncbi:MAG: hypothetical protein K2L95_01505 [Alphaproteobacteria bacterium]|nr:hypothetical protein [Alphaproteobacteria bacterium]